MNFTIVPAAIAQLTTGHIKLALPAPQGGGALLSPKDLSFIESYHRSLKSIERRLIDLKTIDDGKRKYKLYHGIRDIPFELKARKIDPKTGKAVEEVVWNTASEEDEIRVRGARKQISARSVVPSNLRDTTEIILPVKDEEGNTVGWEAVRSAKAFGPSLGTRTTNFSTGMKYSGSQKDIKRAQKERDETVKVNTPEGTQIVKVAEVAKVLPTVDPTAKKLEELEAKVKALLGLLKK